MREKPGIMMSALYGGILTGMLYGVPYLNLVNCLCCAGVILGGVLSVFFYKNDLQPDMPPLESGDGIKLGALSGVVGGVFGTILNQLFLKVSQVDPRLELEKALEQFHGQEGEAFLREIAGFMDSPYFILASLIFSVMLCVVFGILGGLIGYTVFKPKQQPTPYR